MVRHNGRFELRLGGGAVAANGFLIVASPVTNHPLFNGDLGGVGVGGLAPFGQLRQRACHAQRRHYVGLSPQADQDAFGPVKHPGARHSAFRRGRERTDHGWDFLSLWDIPWRNAIETQGLGASCEEPMPPGFSRRDGAGELVGLFLGLSANGITSSCVPDARSRWLQF